MVFRQGDDFARFAQTQGIAEMPSLITWPESELLDYSVARICKRAPLQAARPVTTKLATLDDLCAWFGSRPGRDQSVGLVSGSFDLIHPGHIRLIQAARAHADRLVVLTMSSDSIHHQEKNCLGDRPIYSARDRIEVLAALRPVDCIVLFDDLNCLPSLERFCPDYYFKNVEDQTRPVIQAEAELVKRLGGQTVYLEDPLRSFSSTEIIEYIRGQVRTKHADRFALPRI
jgi:D-beta-D-heptose 7-phosphate kinase/D-beta-D-heptose 1-phosphate adenosyltransferase